MIVLKQPVLMAYDETSLSLFKSYVEEAKSLCAPVLECYSNIAEVNDLREPKNIKELIYNRDFIAEAMYDKAKESFTLGGFKPNKSMFMENVEHPQGTTTFYQLQDSAAFELRKKRQVRDRLEFIEIKDFEVVIKQPHYDLYVEHNFTYYARTEKQLHAFELATTAVNLIKDIKEVSGWNEGVDFPLLKANGEIHYHSITVIQ